MPSQARASDVRGACTVRGASAGEMQARTPRMRGTWRRTDARGRMDDGRARARDAAARPDADKEYS
jgi:hypothetical protein